MSKIDQNIQQICDTLVYRYLVENRHLKTAELLKEERRKVYTLEVKKDEKVSKTFSFMITNYVQLQLELDTVSNHMVYDFLRNHKNQNIQKLAEKLKALIPPMKIRGENPSIGEILNHANFSRKILVPVRKKSSNQLPNNQAKKQKSSMKKVSGIALKSKAPAKNVVYSYSFGSGEKIVPIKSVFENRNNDIECFKQDKPGVYQVLKYILGSDIKVMKAQADTIDIILEIDYDRSKIPNRSKSLIIEKKIKLGPFSHAISGENSEEHRVTKAWYELIEEAQIIDKKQVIKDLDNLMNKQWPCNIVGCYLSKYLQVPRLALKVFELLTRSVFYNSGRFQEGEVDIIIQHMESQNGNEADLNYLKLKLNRPRIYIYNRIANLKAPKARKGQRFTVDEYMVILKHVLGTKIPKEANEIIKLCDKTRKRSWKLLESKLQRNENLISAAWAGFIHSTILAHLSGTLNLDCKKNFFQFIIDKKYISVTDIDWNVVKKTWPSISKQYLSNVANRFVERHGKRGVPLYQNIYENLHHMKNSKKASKIKLDLIDEFEKLRNKD